MMLSHETGPEIKYRFTFKSHLRYIFNIRISILDKDIVLYDDDIKRAFRHPKYHPNMAAAFSFIIANLLFITVLTVCLGLQKNLLAYKLFSYLKYISVLS